MMPDGTICTRPIRELVCPEIEEPIDPSAPGTERRQSHRYARHLPGSLILGQAEYPVTCLDIGYGGMLVDAPRMAAVVSGDRAVIRIQLGNKSFQDEFSVVHTERAGQRTTIHLGL